ncbi:MAG TPA: tetratricopeptide repeat protein [Edaphobacter sp.]|uniref:tetratricopeptide repeat protein n=1 Tax=Edaphobacter sp. TaxID=1934404 RepID=UPI002BC1C6B3|nr:tetratricopeptide repeat protein [Edaphobacter sp.]HUZ96665.1 tetratricopeptide repeat protein [Edaphobacter sp.]
MPKPTHQRTSRTILRPRRFAVAASVIFFGLLSISSLRAQLPAGTTDTTASQPQSQSDQDPLRAQANAALDQHDFPVALKLLTNLAAKYPSDAHLLYDLGFTQESLDQTSNAADTYRRAAAADPKYFEPHLSLGLLFARTGQHDQARAELLTATTLTPSADPALKARAWRALARLDQATRPADASNELLEAMKTSPETPDDIILSGELAEASSDLPGAEAAYRRLLSADPQNATATAALVHLLEREKKADQAEALLTAALGKDPNDPTLNAQLASLYDSQNQPDKAIPLIEKLHAANPADAGITRMLAHLYSSNSQFEKAAPLYATLTNDFPNDPTLVTDRADALIHLRQFAEAESMLKRTTSSPSAFPTKDDLGLAASHLAFAASANDDPTTCLQALAIRDKVLPQSPSSLFLAATAHDKLHQIMEARDLYKQFLSVANGKFPNEEWQARHRLVTLDHTR